MGFNYITIEREYGSGDTEIEKLLAERTGVKCYGSEIMEFATAKMNTTSECII